MVSVQSTIDTNHEDMIHDAQMDFYGRKLATCSSDCLIKMFDVRSGNTTFTQDLRGHEGPVWQLAWSHPKFGGLLASCGYDRKVIIWKENNHVWEMLHKYDNHDSSVNSVQWAPAEYGLMLACGSSDGAISIISSSGDGDWETKKINNAHSIGCNAVSWGPSTHPASIIEGASGDRRYIKRFVSGGCDNLIKIWREEDGQWVEEQKLESHSDWVRDVAWAPSIGGSRNVIASGGADCRVVIWSNDSQTGAWTHKELQTFNDVIWHVSWSITGNILAVSGGDNKVSLWKENMEGQWVCISDVVKGQGQLKSDQT